MTVVKLKRKPRPLKRTFNPTAPYVVERHDQEDGSITYEVWDYRPESYRRICSINEYNDSSYGTAKWDAENTVAALNLRVQYGMEKLPVFKDEP